MKQTHATIVRQAIKYNTPKNHIWKWNLKGDTLKWSYGADFEITISELKKDEDGDEYYIVKTTYQGETYICTLAGKCCWTDYQTVEEAVYAVVALTMQEALRTF